MNTSHPSALPPATKLFLDALQAGGKLNSPTGPTVLAQAGAQMGVNPQQGIPAEAPPEEQQGIAAILNQAQQAGPTIANNQATAQQQQLVDQAANKAAPAAAQMLQQTQQPQGMAHGGLAALPAHIQEFKEGGVIGYAGVTNGSYVQDDTQQQKQDIETARQIFSGSGDALKSLAAAGYDLATLLPRGAMGAAETLITRPLRALGVPIPYLPAEAYGGDASSLTPMTDKLRRAALATAPAPEVRVDNYAPTSTIDVNGVAHPITYATPQELAAEKLNAPRSGVTAKANQTPAGSSSSKVSASTREKIGSPTAPEKSGIDAIPVPSAQPIDMTEANALYEQSKQLRANKPDFELRGLADIAAMQQRDKDSSSFRRFAAIAGARQPGINAGSSMMAAAGKFAETEDALANQADAAKTALAKAKYAESVGDVDALLKYQEEFNKHKEAYSTLKEHLDATIYNAKMLATSREEIAAVRADAAQQMMALRLQTAAIGKNLKNPVDVMNIIEDNMEKYMKGWTDSREGRMAKGPEREAEYNKRKLQMILEMKAMGAVVPEGVEKLLGKVQTTRTVDLNP